MLNIRFGVTSKTILISTIKKIAPIPFCIRDKIIQICIIPI